MGRSLVMTVIGPDRPGLVEHLAAAITASGGNWLESRMSHLGGQFAGILHVEVPPETEHTLISAVEKLEAQGLKVVAHRDSSATPFLASRLLHLEVVGQDRPGIVRQIAKGLSEFGVNVEELHTECASAAMSGETMFTARARLSVPDNCDSSRLRERLEKIAEDLIVEISLEEMQGEPAGKS